MMPILTSRISKLVLEVIRKIHNSQKAFTLLEIMIVIGIIAATLGLFAPKLFKSDKNIKATVRKLSLIGKEIRNRAKMQNTSFRLVLEISEKKPRYWVESANGKVLIDKELVNRTDLSAEETALLPKFSRDTFFGKEPKELPSGTFFIRLESVSMNDPLDEGTGYIYFSPEGFVETSILQIGDKKDMIWSLIFNPLTGQADIIDSAKSLKDLEN